MRFLLALVVLLGTSPGVARPKPKHPTMKNHQSKVWTGWQAGGTCTADDTQVIEMGDALSILLDRFGVEMPQGAAGDGTNCATPAGSRCASSRRREDF